MTVSDLQIYGIRPEGIIELSTSSNFGISQRKRLAISKIE